MTEEPDLPPPTPEERELSRKLGELSTLEDALASRELALASLEVELHIFEVHYLATVGKRYAELDALEAEIAEFEAARRPEDAELLERAEEARVRAQESEDALRARSAATEKRAGAVPESLRKLFRQVARAIHPDLAEGSEAVAKRQELMAAANRAYVTGDEQQLAAILKDWEESPEAIVGHGAAVDLLRAIRQIARVEERIAALDLQLAELQGGDLAQLRARVEKAEADGRDLLAEMAAALEPRIEQARVLLEALFREEEASA